MWFTASCILSSEILRHKLLTLARYLPLLHRLRSLQWYWENNAKLASRFTKKRAHFQPEVSRLGYWLSKVSFLCKWDGFTTDCSLCYSTCYGPMLSFVANRSSNWLFQGSYLYTDLSKVNSRWRESQKVSSLWQWVHVLVKRTLGHHTIAR